LTLKQTRSVDDLLHIRTRLTIPSLYTPLKTSCEFGCSSTCGGDLRGSSAAALVSGTDAVAVGDRIVAGGPVVEVCGDVSTALTLVVADAFCAGVTGGVDVVLAPKFDLFPPISAD